MMITEAISTGLPVTSIKAPGAKPEEKQETQLNKYVQYGLLERKEFGECWQVDLSKDNRKKVKDINTSFEKELLRALSIESES